MSDTELDDLFDLDIQITPDSGPAIPCNTNDTCGQTCASACNSAI